jgi:predicted ATPase
MNRLKLANIGQLRAADLEFGDLTVFVGPQATGKSIALQFLELVEDNSHGPIRERLLFG